MEGVIRKLRFRGQDRIAVVDAPDSHFKRLKKKLSGVQVDSSIDQRFLYEFMVVFVRNSTDIKKLSSVAIHNLADDGVLWFAYPKKSARKISSDVDRDHGWEPLEAKGFRRVSQVNVDDTWSALRFRNAAYVRSAKKEII